MNQNSKSDQYRVLQEEKFLSNLGYEYTELLCTQLDMQKEQWQDLQVPKSLDVWLLKFIKMQKRKHSGLTKQIMKWAAVFLLMVIAANALLITSVEAYRIGFMKAIINMRDGFMSIDYQKDKQVDTEHMPEDWDNLFYLSYVPEGYSISDSGSNPIVAYIMYKNSEEDMIIFQQFYEGANMQLNTEGSQVRDIIINGEKAILIEHPEVTMLTWVQDDIALYLETRQLPSDEIIKMAESLVLTNKEK